MKRKPRVAAKVIVGCSVVAFVAMQVALNVAIELRQPEIYDAEFRDRLTVLRQRLAEEPTTPLLLLVGSSRIITDFRPEVLPTLHSSRDQSGVIDPDERVLPFNFSHSGAGPLLNLVMVQRLLRAGVQPRWLVIEVVPPLLGASGQSTAAALAEGSDLPLLARYVKPWKLAGYYARERVTAGFSHRDACLRWLAPWSMAKPPQWDAIPLDDLGGTTSWLDFQTGPQDLARRTAVVHDEYAAALQHFHIANEPDRALRELLQLCRGRGIKTALLLAPESSTFRSWYAVNANATLQRYCDQLSRDYGVVVADTRTWLPDDAFIDGHHILPKAAEQFTLRLGREVLQPLISGTEGGSSSDHPPRLAASRPDAAEPQ